MVGTPSPNSVLAEAVLAPSRDYRSGGPNRVLLVGRGDRCLEDLE
jgi:hypothetical protein